MYLKIINFILFCIVFNLVCFSLFLIFNFFLDFRLPWKRLAESKEQYSLKWESQYLLQLGTAMEYIVSGAVSMATQEALKHTILSGRGYWQWYVLSDLWTGWYI